MTSKNKSAVKKKSLTNAPAVGDSRRIVLFDFDGTLSANDANRAFWRYCFRHSIRPWLFSPIVACGFVLMAVSKVLVKIRLASSISRIAILWREMTRCFYTPALVEKLRPGFIAEFRLNRFGWASDQVAKERAAGSIVILSSAGLNYLINPLVHDMEFDYIITSNTDEHHPWKILFFNYGENKVESFNALMAALSAGDAPLRVVRSYSDNRSDMPMMALAREQVWINPKTGIVREVISNQ